MALMMSRKKSGGAGTATYTDVSSSLTSSANQNYVVSTTADLSEYDELIITATYNSAKTGSFTSVTGCTKLYEIDHGHTIETYNNNVKLVVISDISASGFTLSGTAVGTGGSGVSAIGVKYA